MRSLHTSYHPKIIGDILKNARKTDTSVEMRLYDFDNKNETRNEKQMIKIRYK